MSMSGHVQTKHEIEYGGTYFGWNQDRVYWWLVEHDVNIYSDEGQVEYATEWEVNKSDLRAIPASAFGEIDDDGEFDADEMREFVKAMIEAPTGEYAYVSWF